MLEKDFNGVVKNRLDSTLNLLVVKGKEYRRNDNVFHNFEQAARISGSTREKAMWGFALKHEVSFWDILNDLEKGILPSVSVLEEKIGDLVTYLCIMEASIKDKIKKAENDSVLEG